MSEPDAGESVGHESSSDRELRRAIEALVMVSEAPVPAEFLAQLLECSTAKIETLCLELAADYDVTDRGFQLAKVGGGWRYQSHPDMSPYIERYVLDGQSSRLSQAALETLSIVAYKQPISRAQVAAIRGVNVDGVMRTLTQRGYVDEVGRDPGPGQAVLYGTTASFLEKLGLNSVDELPPLGGFVPGADVYEALEQGLRVRPELSDGPADDDDGDADGADEAAPL